MKNVGDWVQGVAGLFVVVIVTFVCYHALKGAGLSRQVEYWKARADTAVTRNAELLATVDTFARRQARTNVDRADALAQAALERSEAERLRGVVARLRAGTSSPPPIVPGCERWVEQAEALSSMVDTVTALAGAEQRRAIAAEYAAQVAELGRLSALGRVDSLTIALAASDTLVRTAPIPKSRRVSLTFGARARIVGTGEAFVGLTHRNVTVSGVFDHDARKGIEVEYRQSLRVF